MPNNRVKTIKALQSKKTKIATGQVHPNSRRAKQLQRVVLRATKLEHEAKVRRSNEVDRVDRHLFFVHALPAEATSLSLPELHQLLESYLDRNQPELVDLQHERESRGSWRKSEGKGKREVEIEKTREQEVQEYKAGFVLPDLTVAENVTICRQWINPAPSKESKNAKGGDPSYLGRIRMVRIFEGDRNAVVVEKQGARTEWEQGQGEVEMEAEDDDDGDSAP
ncbi:hypothetical protein JCM8115_004932 [Rhodotorula mucilaginosa]|uniref:Translation machinery-associated protein 16 n=1 Tax=Rhodotorula mucilaginosa TaxID=5537 RepID=A0A9P7B3R9_RHOMI|nr:hypothetical protein C6P46_006777 [Rhodotorula mucilaginosa]TKA56490.1 hypothetical protein B0A53_02061 [Rhodotorula sp. CCFEE 5036]